jgi:undecaprenyl-diphosphatase
VRAQPLQIVRRLWQRHRWSVPLSIGSAFFFARLASEMREGEIGALDASVQHLVDGCRGRLDGLMTLLTRGGDVLPMSILTVLIAVTLMARSRSKEARHLLVSAAGCLLFNLLLKALFHRARPSSELPYILPRPASWSFPSGHTMGTTGVIGSCLVIIRVLRPSRLIWGAALFVGCSLILGVAVSRVYLGAHYASDVIGGLLAALAWLSAVTGWVYPRLLPGERTVR